MALSACQVVFYFENGQYRLITSVAPSTRLCAIWHAMQWIALIGSANNRFEPGNVTMLSQLWVLSLLLSVLSLLLQPVRANLFG
jgi:hypothetical protein